MPLLNHDSDTFIWKLKFFIIRRLRPKAYYATFSHLDLERTNQLKPVYQQSRGQKASWTWIGHIEWTINIFPWKLRCNLTLGWTWFSSLMRGLPIPKMVPSLAFFNRSLVAGFQSQRYFLYSGNQIWTQRCLDNSVFSMTRCLKKHC